MKKRSKIFVALALAMLMIIGTLLSGCSLTDIIFKEEKSTPKATKNTVTASPDATVVTESDNKTLVLEGIEADYIQHYDCKESGNFSVIRKDGKYGIIGYDGKFIISPQFKDIYQGYGFGYDFLIARDADDNEFLIDPDGSLRELYFGGGDVDPIYFWYQNEFVAFIYGPDVIRKGDPEGENLFDVSIEKKDWEDGAVLPVQELSGLDEKEKDVVSWPIVNNPKYALVDTEKGVLVSDFIYETFDGYNGFREGLLGIKKDGKLGYIDKKGNVVIDFLYDARRIEPQDEFNDYYHSYSYAAVNGYIAVSQNGLWGLIDTKGNVVVDIEYEGISQVNSDGLFWLKEEGKWSLYKINLN